MYSQFMMHGQLTYLFTYLVTL